MPVVFLLAALESVVWWSSIKDVQKGVGVYQMWTAMDKGRRYLS